MDLEQQRTAVENYIGFENERPVLKIDREKINKQLFAHRDVQDGNLGCVVFFLNATSNGEYSRNKAQERGRLDAEAEKKFEEIEQIIPLIEDGINELSAKVGPFVDNMPIESLGRKAVEKFGRATICEVTEVAPGLTIAAFRGEFSRTSGSGSGEKVYNGAFVTSEGELYTVETRGSGKSLRDLLKTVKTTGFPERKTEIERFFLGRDINDSFYHFDPTDDTRDGCDFKQYMISSQRRALQVALDIGIKNSPQTGPAYKALFG